MKANTIWIFFFIVATGALSQLHAGERTGVALPYDIMDPSVRLAKRYQLRGDYATAILLYDAILKRNPSDSESLKAMVDCHQAMLHKETPEPQPVAKQPEPVDDDGLADLPNFSSDNVDAQKLAQKPQQPVF